MKFLLFAFGLLVLISACSRSEPVEEMNSRQARDFYLYSCVSEYMNEHAIRNFDGSVAHIVENSELDANQLTELYSQAQDFSHSLPPPDYEDPEHGLPPVMALCKKSAINTIR